MRGGVHADGAARKGQGSTAGSSGSHIPQAAPIVNDSGMYPMRRVLICLAAISFSCGLLFAVEGDAKTCAPLATMDNPQLAIDPLFNLPKWAVDLGAKTREKPSDADVPDCPIPSDCQKLCLNDL